MMANPVRVICVRPDDWAAKALVVVHEKESK